MNRDSMKPRALKDQSYEIKNAFNAKQTGNRLSPQSYPLSCCFFVFKNLRILELQGILENLIPSFKETGIKTLKSGT